MTDESQNASDDIDKLIDAMSALLQPLLQTMEVFNHVSRHLHPPKLPEIAAAIQPYGSPLQSGLDIFQAAEFPPHMAQIRECLIAAAGFTADGLQGMQEAAASSDGRMLAYRALRRAGRAQEMIYPLAGALAPVNQFFLEPEQRQDQALIATLAADQGQNEGVGIVHANNEKDERGGFSLYVPEYYDGSEALPLVMALHGGSGHGREFLWSWLRTARSLGAIVVSPTSRGPTWDLMGPDVDSPNIEAMLNHVREAWNVDDSKMLLTGMSDGGTFSYVSGLMENSPFTHLAPVSASFHPMLLEMCDRTRLSGLPIYLVHGALDWMFDIDIARTAHQALAAADADVTYREIEDLSHTYPKDESPKILNWLKQN